MPRGKGRGKRGGRKVTKSEHAKEEGVIDVSLDSSITNSDDCEIIEVNEILDKKTRREEENVSASLKTEVTSQTKECDEVSQDTNGSGENCVIELDNEKGSTSEIAEVDKCPEKNDLTNNIGDKLDNSIQQNNDVIIHDNKDSNIDKTETLSTQQTEAKQIIESDNIGEKSAEVVSVDDIQTCDDLPNFDKKVNNDHIVVDLEEESSRTVKNNQHNILETDNSNSNTSDKKISPALLQSQKVEELESNTFEEISEGSIEQNEQDDLIDESLSDVEITGESFDPKKIQNKNHSNFKGQNKLLYKNEKSKAENEDNDDISDTSLSDHVDAELSLEEISDDELEPSKKRRKSLGQLSGPTGDGLKVSDGIKLDKDKTIRAVGKLIDIKTDRVSEKSLKHAASDDENNSSSNKRMKFDESNDVEEVSSIGEEDLAFSTDNCHGSNQSMTKHLGPDGFDASCNKNVVLSDRNVSQTPSNWRQNNATIERQLEPRDLVGIKRKYNMVDSSTQSEPRLLKGKIIQCNINPIKLTHKLKENSSEFELLSKFKNKLHSEIPDIILSDVCSLLPSQTRGTYSVNVGPLKLTHTQSSTFKDILNGTESFSLVFANHFHGILNATFVKRDHLLLLLTWLNHQEPKSHDMVVSVLYTGEEEGNSSIWRGNVPA